jgi:uncharacterized protein (TIGR01244 family)
VPEALPANTALLLALLSWGGGMTAAVTAPEATTAVTAATELEELLPDARKPRPGLLTGGQPTSEQLAAIAEAGYQTVINLRPPEEPGSTRPDQVEAAGMRYLEIPVSGAETLTDEAVARLAAALAEPDGGPFVIQCSSGNRVGALLALMAHRVEGRSPEEALELGLAGGLTRLEPAVRERLGLPPATSDP